MSFASKKSTAIHAPQPKRHTYPVILMLGCAAIGISAAYGHFNEILLTPPEATPADALTWAGTDHPLLSETHSVARDEDRGPLFEPVLESEPLTEQSSGTDEVTAGQQPAVQEEEPHDTLLLITRPNEAPRTAASAQELLAALPAPQPHPKDQLHSKAAEPRVQPEAAPYRKLLTEKVRSGDNLAKIFTRMGLNQGLLDEIIHSNKTSAKWTQLKPGHELKAWVDAHGEFLALSYPVSLVETLEAKRIDDRIRCELVSQPVERRIVQKSGVIQSSLFASADRAGLSDAMTMKLASIFGWDIDFALEVRPGDTFAVVYQEDWVKDTKVHDGDILAAEFVNAGTVHRAVRYEVGPGMVDYYSPDGQEMRKAFMRTPVKFNRISSGFTMSRWHPLLQTWRAHKGVDYTAPTGTPVMAVGKGEVSFKGEQSGYGNVVMLQHGEIYTTVYGHLSGFAKDLKKGSLVKQGQVIGYVGQTGLASGPHLHYEFRVKGTHQDPLTVKLPKSLPLPGRQLKEFRSKTAPLLAKLDAGHRTELAQESHFTHNAH